MEKRTRLRVGRAGNGYAVYEYRDIGGGWDKQIISRHKTEIDAARELLRLQKTLHERGCQE